MNEAQRMTRGATRRALLLGGAGAAGGLVAACAGAERGTTPSALAPANVEWFVWATGGVWAKVAGLYMEQRPQIKVTVPSTSSPAEEFNLKLQANVAAGTAPDLAMSAPGSVPPLVTASVYRPVDELAKKDKAALDAHYPAALDTFRVRGKLYGLWHYANPQVVFYNQELLAKSGAPEPSAEWTYEQWLDSAKKVTKRIGDVSTDVWGTDAPIAFNYVFNAVRSYGGTLFDSDDDPKRFTGTNAKALEGLQFLADLLLTHRVAPAAADRQGQGNLFYAGRQAFLTNIVVNIGATRTNMKQAWDVAPMPRGPAGRSCFFGGNGTAFTVPSNRDGAPAWEFLKFLAGPVGQREFLTEFGAMPTVKAVAESEYLKQAPPPAKLKVVVDAMTYIKPLPKLTTMEAQKTLDTAFQEIFAGKKTARAAMTEIEDAMNRLLKG